MSSKPGKSKKSKQKPTIETELAHQSINQSIDEEEINATDELQLTPSPVEKKKKSKKSTNQSTNQSTSQSAKQSTNQSIKQPVRPPIASPVNIKSPSSGSSSQSIKRSTSQSTYRSTNQSTNQSSPTGLNLSSLHPANADLALDIGLEEDEDVVMYSVNDLNHSLNQSVNQSINQDDDVLYSVEDLKRQRAEQLRRDKLVAKQRKLKEKEIQAQKKKQAKSSSESSPQNSIQSPNQSMNQSINQSIQQSDDTALTFDDEDEAGHEHTRNGSYDGFTALKGVGPNGSSAYYLLLVLVSVLTVSMVGMVVYYTEHVNAEVVVPPIDWSSSSTAAGILAPSSSSSSAPSS